MKMIFVLSMLELLLFNKAYAIVESQSIDCKYSTSENKDHILLSLKDTQNGTFYYSSEIETTGEDQNSGTLTMIRVDDSKAPLTKKDFSQFSSKLNTIEEHGTVEIEFLFSMPKNLILKSSNSFKASLATNIIDTEATPDKKQNAMNLHSEDDLVCVAHLIEKK